MLKYIETEGVKFSRPDSDKEEIGCRVTNGEGKSIIIDSDFNIVLNASYLGYFGTPQRIILEEF